VNGIFLAKWTERKTDDATSNGIVRFVWSDLPVVRKLGFHMYKSFIPS
jgi:gentisate 1,2-dioxygenase